MVDLTDEEIALKVQSGMVEPFGILVGRYEEKIKRYGRKFLSGYEDVEDVVQEVFIKTYANIQSFDASKKFSPWIYRIAHNEFINQIKKKKREPLPLFNPDSIFPNLFSKERVDGESEKKEMREFIDKCLDKLKPKYREILTLFYLEELSYQEISDILHIPVSTIGVRLKRAKSLLKLVCNKYE